MLYVKWLLEESLIFADEGSIPALNLLLLFTYILFAKMIQFSFYDMKYLGARTFVGMKNYAEVFDRKEIFGSLFNSLYYMGGGVVQLALFFATMMVFKVKGESVFKGALFFPYLICGIAVGFIFKVIGRNPAKEVARIFNSAVIPYQDGFIGVFRGEQTNGIPHIYLGRSKDAVCWKFDEEKISFADEEGIYYLIWCQDFYGAADTYVGLAFTTAEEIIAYIKEHSVVREADQEIGRR